MTNPTEYDNITAAISELNPFLQITATLSVNFRGDITVQTTMEAYSSIWQILSGYLNNYTLIHAEDIWSKLQYNYALSFDLVIDPEVLSDSSINYDIELVSAGDGSVLQDFRTEYLSSLIPGQIIASIMTASVSAIWMLDRENTTGLLKRMKLTKLSSPQYLGSILLAWSVIAILQGLFLLVVSAILGFFNFGINPLGWIFMLLAMVLLGIISATFALLIGSFANARIASPFMIMVFSTAHMFIGEYFFQVEPVFTFAGKNFSGLDFVFMRPAFLVMRNGMLLDSNAGIENIWFDFLLLFLWALVIFLLGAFIFSKYKLKYAEDK